MMQDIAAIAAELRRELPPEKWGIVDRLVNAVIDDMMKRFNERIKVAFGKVIKEGSGERPTETVST